jgi:solute carrier family 35 protein F5
MFHVEDVTRGKVLSAAASFIGVVLVTRSDSTIESTTLAATGAPAHPVLGDALALLSALFYSIYVILLKVRLGDESRADTQLMLGFAGLFNIIFLIPVFPALHYFGWETFELPPTKGAWVIIIINMLITLSSDYLYVLAMLKTTPMLVTIGLSLTIPFALIGSLIVPSASGESITAMSLAGAALVVGSFLVLGWQGWEANANEERRERERGNSE